MNWLVEVLSYDKFDKMIALSEMKVESFKKNSTQVSRGELEPHMGL